MHLYLEIQTANKIWLSLTRTISRLLYWKHRISYIDGEIIDILMNVVARLEALFLISLCVSSHLAKCPSLHRNTKSFLPSPTQRGRSDAPSLKSNRRPIKHIFAPCRRFLGNSLHSAPNS